MNILKNAIHVTPANRRAIAVLALIVTLTSVKVQAAEMTEVLPEPPQWATENQLSHDTPAAVFVVPTEQAIAAQETKIEVKNEEKKVEAPVAKTIGKKVRFAKGPDLETVAARSSEPAARVVIVPVTAYTSDPRETDATPFITANGTQVFDGVVAANFLKFGTRVRIPDYFGDKVFVVHDRMNARYHQRLDIWTLKKSDAKSWGVRRVKVEILP